jgi:hypothetical protein
MFVVDLTEMVPLLHVPLLQCLFHLLLHGLGKFISRTCTSVPSLLCRPEQPAADCARSSLAGSSGRWPIDGKSR